MLRDLHNDTFDNVVVKSISGAKVTDVFRELNLQTDLKRFKDIVIHAGTNDVDSENPIDEITGSMEAIITLIMVEAPMSHIHLSAVCPRTRSKNSNHSAEIGLLNEKLKDLADRLDCNFIDAGENMTYRNGSVDTSQLMDGLHLSSRGTETLIKAYTDSIENLQQSSETWCKVVKSNRRQRSNHDNGMHQRSRQRKPAPQIREVNSFYQRRKETAHRRISRSCESTVTPFSKSHNAYTGCFNCGLRNHNQSTCRFNKRISCHACGGLGHKERYCQNRV